MPNWCENELKVKGPKEDLVKFRQHAIFKMGDDYNNLDFNKFIQMPEELNGIHHGATNVNGKSVTEWRDVKDKDGKIKRVEVNTEELISKYGFSNWYDWAYANWGTKWNTSEVSVKEYPGGLLYNFDTAWSPPSPVILAMAKAFPTLEFTLKYWEGGSAFKGIFKIKGEEVLEDDTSKYNGRRGG